MGPGGSVAAMGGLPAAPVPGDEPRLTVGLTLVVARVTPAPGR
jgi:hypothetical protein